MPGIKHKLSGLREQAANWFEAGLLPWYHRLQPREQRVLQGAAILVPVLIVVFGIILPLHDRMVRLRSDVGSLAAQAQEADRLADHLHLHGKKITPSVNPMFGVEQAAQQARVRGFIIRIKPDLSFGGGRQHLVVNMKAAPYADVIRFLGLLQAKGMSVSNAKLYAIDKPGFIDVQMTLTN